MSDSNTAGPLTAADVHRYRSELTEFSLTEEQEVELLEILFSIMRSMVELGFDVNICEQFFAESNPGDEPPALGVESLRSQFSETVSRGNGKDGPE